MNEVAPKVAATHTGAAILAPAPAAAQLLPQAARVAAPFVGKGKELLNKGTTAAGNAFKNGMIKTARETYKAERAVENEFMSKPDYYTNLANDFLSPMPPAVTGKGQIYNALTTGFDQLKRSREGKSDKQTHKAIEASTKSHSWRDR